MRDALGDLWTYGGNSVVARVITTNGFVKRDGRAVMGRGCAMEARDRFRGLDSWLGEQIGRFGNRLAAAPPNPAKGRPFWLITFPVKPVSGPNGEPGFSCPADPAIIRESATDLLSFTLGMLPDGGDIVLPRPGCGNGRLSWDSIRPLLAEELDQPVSFEGAPPVSIGDRFVCVTKK